MTPPTIAPTAGACSTPSTDIVAGLYADGCLKALVPWVIRLPDLSDDYVPFGYTVETADSPSTVTVTYRSAHGDARISGVQYTITLAFALTLPRFESSQIVNGVTVKLFSDGSGAQEVYWGDARFSYELRASSTSDPDAVRAFLVSSATTFIASGGHVVD